MNKQCLNRSSLHSAPCTLHSASRAFPMRSLTFLVLSLILGFSVTAALAEDGRTKTYIRMEETEIIGVVEHPEITYIIPKTRIRFNQIPLERDFTSETTRFTNPFVIDQEVRLRTLLYAPPGAKGRVSP